MARNYRRLLTGTACLAALALAGCGGGGGSRPQPAPPPPATIAPTPTPTPPPPPPPPPPGSNFNDAEYANSSGASAAGAISAYNAGATGRGVTIGVIDSGINPGLAEFAGRIHPASRDIASSRGVVDNEGHGTAVAGTAAAARNGSGMMGVAFESTILSLNTSDPNDCDADDGCSHSDADIAQAVDVARANGARVINISLGGDSVAPVMLSAVQRAAAAGIVVVMSAGNEGEEATGANPGAFALDTARLAGSGHVIIAGAHDAARNITDFSNRAGTGAAYYLTALGSRVRTFDQNGTSLLYSGTSFSAPVISGAAALLASAFPNLTGAQIVELLLTTADDAGAAGLDAVYGNGILNIARAFAPRGTTALAGSAAPVSLTDNGQTSGPMGDAKGPTMAGAIVLDGYSRAYALDLARTLSSASQERPLAQALQGDVRSATAAAGHTAVSITMQRNLRGQPQVGLAQTGLSYEDGRRARAVAGFALTRLSPATLVALGFSESGRALQQRLAGASQGAFLVARDPMARTGFTPRAGSAVGVRHDLGPVALTVTAERGEVQNDGIRRSLLEPGYSLGSVTADRSFGPLSLTLGASRLHEEGTILGARFGSALGGGGATSTFVDGAAAYDLGRGWSLRGSYRRGWTSSAGGGLADGAHLSSDAFAFDLSKHGAFADSDRLAFRVMQPLRVRSGGFDLNVPVSYDYFSGDVGYEARQYSLSPSGREIDFEAAYGIGLFGGDFSANLFLRTDPGHIDAAPDDLGGAVRFTLGF